MLPFDKTFFFWPGKASMEFLSPVDPADFSDAVTLKKHVFQLMWNELSK
jgi:hypothetical protein